MAARVGEWLQLNYDAPWSALRFYVAGRDVYFRDDEIDAFRSGRQPEQTVVPIELTAVAAATQADADRMRERAPDEVGRIERHRNVAHNQWVVAGTRIRTEAVWNFHEAGHSVPQILRQYPRLVEEDVNAAIAFECDRRQQRTT